MAVVFPEYIPDSFGAPVRAARVRPPPQPQPGPADIGQRFEQMLWSEMLSHAGLEKAFTQTGGEAAAAFSRFIVEAIAEDIAKTHPLGLTRPVVPPAPSSAARDADA